MKPNENMCNMEMVNKLKRVFNSKNRFTIPDQLFNLIKFETTSYISVNKQINPIRKKRTRLYLNLIMELYLFYNFQLLYFRFFID